MMRSKKDGKFKNSQTASKENGCCDRLSDKLRMLTCRSNVTVNAERKDQRPSDQDCQESL